MKTTGWLLDNCNAVRSEHRNLRIFRKFLLKQGVTRAYYTYKKGLNMLEISLVGIISIIVMAFFCEYMDSSLGMGYGTTLIPVLLLFSFTPIQVVPAVLCSELFTGLLAGILHHRQGNVNFMPKTTNPGKIIKSLSALGYIESFKSGIPLHFKVALLLALCSIFGTVVAVFIAVNIPKFWLKLYIG